ncbi:hypothetical protein CHLNCDRAFT_139338 [Chlorella variabilis]|uniref:Uncharacterized protein n=1 Tax=Chlorella variabilis TaxID=554065 RepID=E1ZQ21_CHLVA|nr:hypothetical protein CHLNCDRAFT_139338 [Chlorella variabilis]EFN52080.1 hypothetical protein CHLNCDRAFT_139338 [Chlorella variabilis]|eukprot:XP_005844182.1 hypothetical protein CHLNCDRAFT_139338 [Chlorella variabilis]
MAQREDAEELPDEATEQPAGPREQPAAANERTAPELPPAITREARDAATAHFGASTAEEAAHILWRLKCVLLARNPLLAWGVAIPGGAQLQVQGAPSRV